MAEEKRRKIMASSNPVEHPKIANSIVDLIGRTPIVRLGKVARDAGVVAEICLKLESMEPCSSVKDRLGKALIEGMEERGEIRPGVHCIVEATSGNTGIALATVCAAKGYECIIVMPSSMSMERRVMLKALGAKLVLTAAVNPTGLGGMKAAIAKANQIVASDPSKYVLARQFDNSDNPKIHRETTGPEIWYQTDGKIDFLVGGVGTGGTITGCAQFLKPLNPNIKIVAIEPSESPVLSGGKPGMHKIQGLGAGFVPGVFAKDLIDEIVLVNSEKAVEVARKVATQEGIFCGISSGASIQAAIEIGSRPENAGKRIVAIIPSFGERYLSTVLFSDLEMEAKAQEIESIANPDA
jgi:cysteine synthase A